MSIRFKRCSQHSCKYKKHYIFLRANDRDKYCANIIFIFLNWSQAFESLPEKYLIWCSVVPHFGSTSTGIGELPVVCYCRATLTYSTINMWKIGNVSERNSALFLALEHHLSSTNNNKFQNENCKWIQVTMAAANLSNGIMHNCTVL